MIDDEKPWGQMTALEREAQALINFHEYGKEAALFAGYTEHKVYYDFERDAKYYSTTPQRLREAYEQGKHVAEQDKQANPARYYLQKLVELMENEDGEWYGADFDAPAWIVKQAIAALEKQQKGPTS